MAAGTGNLSVKLMHKGKWTCGMIFIGRVENENHWRRRLFLIVEFFYFSSKTNVLVSIFFFLVWLNKKSKKNKIKKGLQSIPDWVFWIMVSTCIICMCFSVFLLVFNIWRRNVLMIRMSRFQIFCFLFSS